MEAYHINHNNTTPMQLKPVIRQNNTNSPIRSISTVQATIEAPKESHKAVEPTKVSAFKRPFIESNTTEVDLQHLSQDCIIPVFSKDNEKTIAHQEFIEAVQEAAYRAFPQAKFEVPEIRVSHQLNHYGLKVHRF